jgi:hypothetical protein
MFPAEPITGGMEAAAQDHPGTPRREPSERDLTAYAIIVAILAELRALTGQERPVAGITIAKWRARNVPAAQDMVDAGETPESAAAALRRCSERYTSPIVWLSELQVAMNRPEFRPRGALRSVPATASAEPDDGRPLSPLDPRYRERFKAMMRRQNAERIAAQGAV